MRKHTTKRILALLLTLVLLMSIAPVSFAIVPAFFDSHKDWHFDLTQHPDDPMTVEEFIALTTAYSYWSTGAQGEAPVDKDGDAPSAWAAPYILNEYWKGTIDPSKLDWQAPATLAFVMEYFCHAKGLFSYNAVNLRSFTGTEGLSADQKLCLNTAVDYGIFEYTPDMDVSVTIPRKDLEAKWLIPEEDFRERTPEVLMVSDGYKYSAAFWETNASPEDANEFDFQKKQLNVLKDNLQNFNIVIMNMVSLVDGGKGGYQYLNDRIEYCDEHAEMFQLCKDNGIKVLASVLNFYDPAVLNKMKASDEVIYAVGDEMLKLLDSHPLDGLSVDLEMDASTGTTYRECYTKLLNYIAPKVHERGKLLTVTVGAYMQEKDEKGSMFDYDAIGKCADIVNIINYDDHPAKTYTAGGEMGEVSNYAYVQRCLRYAAMCFGAQKVTLSYATFGVDFNTSKHTAVNTSHEKIMGLIDTYKATPQKTDDEINDAHFSYTDGNGDSHTVYYESDQGIYDRLDLAKRYGLGGASCWLIGWKAQNAFNRMGSDSAKYRPHTKHTYTDVVTAPTCTEQGYTTHVCTCGDSYVDTYVAALGHSFKDGKCIRCPELSPEPAKFVDVAKGVNYYDAVAWAADSGITSGFTPTEFRPKQDCTRAQVVTFLWRAAGEPAPKNAENPFSDVSAKQANGKDNPYYTAILWAAEEGITTGYPGGLFKPNDTVTRAQFVTFLWRFEGKPATTGSINGFADAGVIASPYQQAVAWAVEKGITTGYNDNTFRPNAACTRWAVVLFMYRDLK